MPKKILVVDDESDILSVVKFRLKKEGYEIIEARDGQAALDLVKKEKPDLILLDLRLPVIDGYEVCRRLKSNETLKAIPVIFMTASSAGKVVEKSKEFQADDYIIKPFEPEVLLEKVKKFT